MADVQPVIENNNNNNNNNNNKKVSKRIKSDPMQEKITIRGSVTVILGAQWGDEGKGKLVDDLAKKYEIVARCAGGANAGHTIVHEGKTYKFHLLPSGLINEKTNCLLGNGMVIDIVSLFEEIDKLQEAGIKNAEQRIHISNRAHVVLHMHKHIDALNELQRELSNSVKLGTTGKGIGPCYASKANRIGIRMCDVVSSKEGNFEKKYKEYFSLLKKSYPELTLDAHELETIKLLLPRLKPMVVDTVNYLHVAINAMSHNVLVEGANAALLDIDQGTYPYVTSSNCTVGGACTGLGIPTSVVEEVIAIAKAYTTRVGAGPFPTELKDEIGEHLQVVGKEVGTTTGRKRRCGWFDCVVFNHANKINDFNSINLTKLDVLTGLKEIKVCVSYMLDGHEVGIMPADIDDLERVVPVYKTFPGWDEDITKVTEFKDLPQNALNYVLALESILDVPIRYIGVGPDRSATIVRY